MIDAKEYIETVKDYYSFLITECNLSIINEKIRGNAFYDIQYGDKTKIISISYENIEDYFQVVIFKLQKGEIPNYDDETKTLHLNKLNAVILSKINKEEFDLNNEYFSKFHSIEKLQLKILKSAKELRLFLNHTSKLQTK